MSAAGENFSGRVKAASPGAPATRVRRTIPPAGGVGVRIGVDQFEITTAGTYVGISGSSDPDAGRSARPDIGAEHLRRRRLALPAGGSRRK